MMLMVVFHSLFARTRKQGDLAMCSICFKSDPARKEETERVWEKLAELPKEEGLEFLTLVLSNCASWFSISCAEALQKHDAFNELIWAHQADLDDIHQELKDKFGFELLR